MPALRVHRRPAAERAPSYYSASLNFESDYPTLQGSVTVDVAIIGGRAFPKAVGSKRKALEERISRAGFMSEQALVRELQEEVGITAKAYSLFDKLEYQFPDRHITLWFWLVNSWEGEPWGKEGQPGRWIAQSALVAEDFPPANEPVITKLIQGSQIG